MKQISLFQSTATGTELEAIKKVLDSHWWDRGPVVEQFEQEFAKFVGARYAVATNSCTSALEIAVKISNLGKTITVSPFTFISSAACILRNNRTVKFLDIDKDAKCTPEADIQVLYGGNDFGRGYIYDMAHFGGGRHKGVMSCWSFQARKNLPVGDGGMLTTNNFELYKRAKAISWYGVAKNTFDRSQSTYSWDYDLTELGTKANMNDIVAAIGLEQLKALPENNRKRALVASWYDEYLPEWVERPFRSTTWHLYTIEVPYRDALHEKLKENGVQTGVHYKPLYNYPLFPSVRRECPNTEEIYKHTLSLPMHVGLTEEDVKYICTLI